jgi:hypothetical protein
MITFFAYVRHYLWMPIIAALLWLAVNGVFNSGRVMTCVWGLVIAFALYWMRSKHLA